MTLNRTLANATRLIAPLLLIGCAGAALAAEGPSAQDRWIEIDDAFADETVVMYDTYSLRRDGDLVTVWALFDFSGDARGKYQEARVQYQFDCRRRLSRNLFSVTYSASGDEQKRAGKARGAFEPVVPDTTAESVMLHACAPATRTKSPSAVIAAAV